MRQQHAARGVRFPAVAGLFYPETGDALAATVDRLLESAAAPPGVAPKAIIAPHAGYEYSGPIAAQAYARLRLGSWRRVVLMGPSHRCSFRGIALPGAASFRTPLGDVRIDSVSADAVLELPQVSVAPEAHDHEHSLEVHLPFLQRVLGDFALVPLAVGTATPDEVAAVLDLLWDETLIVISSDLSHYESYRSAQDHDAATAAAIERLDPEALGPDDACGCVPVSGLLLAAQRRGLVCSRIDLRNSGDTAGSKREVVGYGAWAFCEE